MSSLLSLLGRESMKLSNFFVVIIVFLSSCSSNKKDSIEYEWSHSYNGGGGYITSLYQDPRNTDIMYARCDVAGIFKSTDGAKTWENINNGCTEYHQHQIRSFAISKLNPDVLFRCSGSMNNKNTYGDIMKSTDGGESWRVVNTDADFFGNGEGRYFGDVIEVSPTEKNIVVAASFSKGVYVSKDEGETWSPTGLYGMHVGVLKFHPLKPKYVFAGVRNQFPHIEHLKTDGKILDNKGKLYLSNDNGMTWEKMCESEKYDIVDLAFDYSDPDILYVMTTDAIYRTNDNGKTMKLLVKGKQALYGKGFSFVYTHPSCPDKLFSSYQTPATADGVSDFPLIVSVDKGETWEFYKDYSFADFREMPDYIKDLRKATGGISKLLIDASNPDRMFFTNWYGVCRSDDAGKTWSGNYYKGLTTTCVENVVADPNISRKAYFTCADVAGFCTTDGGETYFPIGRTVDEFIHNGTAFCPSRYKDGLIISGITSWPKAHLGSALLRSEDGGKNIDIVMRLEPGQFVQAIKEAYKEGVFYAFVDGDVEKGAGLLMSEDWGNTWKQIQNPFPNYITKLPYRKHWVEFELLPITSYQQKNVCGCDALMDTSPFDGNKLYIGEWTEGLFKSVDSGNSWINISKGLPFNNENDSITTLVSVKSDPERNGVIYAGFVKEGLWRTEDDGYTWKKIFPKDGTLLNASSVFVGGMTDDELYVACEPLYWSPAKSAIYYSPDRGETWTEISDNSFGSIRWKGIAVDKTTGTIYTVSNGNGAFYAKRKY